MYKAKKCVIPDYLLNLYPPLIENSTPDNVRNANNYATLPRRLDIISNSFISSSIELWNALPLEIQSSDSLLILKNALMRSFLTSHLSLSSIFRFTVVVRYAYMDT